MLIGYLILINAVGFLLMLSDKLRARKKLWRIPETTLIGISIIGGSLGIVGGLYTFRHKTKHLKFTMGIPLILALQIIAAVLVLIWI